MVTSTLVMTSSNLCTDHLIAGVHDQISHSFKTVSNGNMEDVIIYLCTYCFFKVKHLTTAANFPATDAFPVQAEKNVTSNTCSY